MTAGASSAGTETAVADAERPTVGLLIGGKIIAGDLSMPVINPATEEPFAYAPRSSREQLDAAVRAAVEAFPQWSQTPLSQRQGIVAAIADVLSENAEELSMLIVLEQGKTLREARREIGGAAAFCRFAATLELPTDIRKDGSGREFRVEHRPLGPVAAIIPWNYPILTIAFKLPWILVAGNTAVIKPSPTTPLATARFGELIAGVVPAGVVNIVVDDNDLGDVLTSHPGIRKVSFTGSTATGRAVMQSAAPTLKRLTLELGGNDVALVLDDVEPVDVAENIFRLAFQNNGQVCLAIKRLYVPDPIYDEVVAELARIADAAVVGDGQDESVDFGPVQNAMQFEKVKNLIESARAEGTIAAGGTLPTERGYFIRPTIVRDIAEGSALVDEEQFGPILPVVRYSSVDDALARLNATAFGLGASVWSSDADRALDVAERIDAGTVWINKHADIAPHIPFAGSKQSGLGTEFALEGLAEFTQLRVISRSID